MPSKIFGRALVELVDLVRALLRPDPIAARQWVADAARERFRWSEVPFPGELIGDELAVAAGIVELLAQRAGEAPPPWTARVPAARQPVLLVHAAASMPRLRKLCEEQGPEPLRRRRILAPPDFLTAA